MAKRSREDTKEFDFDIDEGGNTQEQWYKIIDQLKDHVDYIFDDEETDGGNAAGSDSASTEQGIAGGMDLQIFLDNLKRRIHVEPVAKLVLVGDNGIGKSFLANLLLQLTAKTNTKGYGLLQVRKEMEESETRSLASLKSDVLLISNLSGMEDLETHLRENDGHEFGEETYRDTNISLRFLDYLWDKKVLLYSEEMDSKGRYVEEEKRSLELIHLGNIKKAWKTWPSGDMEKSQFILPSLQGIKATTANQINIRHGTIFHFWIRYKSKLQLMEELASIVETLRNVDEDEDADSKADKRKCRDKYAVLTGKRFSQKEDDPVLCDAIQEVMGKDVVVSGRGFHPLDDRIYVRDELRQRLINKAQSCAIKHCYVYCPSELLERGLELIDTPGANDADPFKYNVLVNTLAEASNVLCVSKRELDADSSLLNLFRDYGVFEKILQPESASSITTKFNLLMFWPANEKENGMAAKNLAKACGIQSEVKKNLETGAGELYDGLMVELEDKFEESAAVIKTTPAEFEQIRIAQRSKVMCGLVLQWASLCMDEEQARQELDNEVAGCYDFVYEKSNGEALLRALFDVRPKPDDVVQQFVNYVRKSSYTLVNDKVEIPRETLNKLKRRLKVEDLSQIDRRFKAQVLDKLKARLSTAVGEGEGDRLTAFCQPFTEAADPAAISNRVVAWVRNTQKARQSALKNAFETKLDKTASIGVWSKTFAGWFPKPQSQEVDDFATRLNDMLNVLVIGPSDAPTDPDAPRSKLLADIEEWLMEEVLLLYGPSATADKRALRSKLEPVVQSTAKRMLETTRWQPSAKVGWVPRNSVHQMIDRAKSKSVKALCEKAAEKIMELKGTRNWRDSYVEAVSVANMAMLVEQVKTELRKEAKKVVKARVEATESKALAGLRQRKQWKHSTFAQKVVSTCAADILAAFEPDPERKRKHDMLWTLCDELERCVEESGILAEDRDEAFQSLLNRVKQSGKQEPSPDLFTDSWEKKGAKKKKRKKRSKAWWDQYSSSPAASPADAADPPCGDVVEEMHLQMAVLATSVEGGGAAGGAGTGSDAGEEKEASAGAAQPPPPPPPSSGKRPKPQTLDHRPPICRTSQCASPADAADPPCGDVVEEMHLQMAVLATSVEGGGERGRGRTRGRRTR